MRTGPIAAAAASIVLLAGIGGCGSSALPEKAEAAQPVVLELNVKDRATQVAVDTLLQVNVQHGTVSKVDVKAKGGAAIRGDVTDAGWRATERLEPGTEYSITAVAQGADGATQKLSQTFRTVKLGLDQQTYPAVAPLEGEKVGVGMPVIVYFDIPVKDRAAFEQHMKVTSQPAVEGSWHWFSGSEAHYRPKTYWPAGAKVKVDLDLNSVPAGGGIYGQQNQDVDFTVGRQVINTVDLSRKQLTHDVDGKTVRTLPISAGDSSHQSRNGVKVIMEKFSSIDMDAATTGVDSSDPGYYNMKGVRWAMRITNSGEFVHAAPWNAGFFGRQNRSHGCTGLSTSDAQWLYQQSRRGDIVKYTGGSRSLEDRNGWTDWNIDWADWTKGSALTQTQS